MRTQIKVTNLSATQWEYLRETLRTEYDMIPNSPLVCVVFERAPMFERHVQMPLSVLKAVMGDLHRMDLGEVARTPDELPDHLEAQRDAADPTRKTCDHGSPVVEETPSVFENAGPVRTYEDGCQSCGPYAARSAAEWDTATQRPLKPSDDISHRRYSR